MKFLVYAFIIFIFFQTASANTIKNTQIYGAAKEILNSFAVLDNNPIISNNNTHNLNSPNNHNSYDGDKNNYSTTNVNVNANKRNIKNKVILNKTEVDLLRAEFLKVSQRTKNTSKNNASIIKTNNHSENEFIDNTENSFFNSDNILQFPSNNNGNKVFKNLKNQTTFIEIDSEIDNKIPDKLLINEKISFTQKENKKLLLLRLKNLLEKYIYVKQQNEKKNKEILLLEKNIHNNNQRQRQTIEKNEYQPNNFDDSNKAAKERKNDSEKNKITNLKKQKEYLEEKIFENNNKAIIQNTLQKELINDFKNDLPKNSKTYNETVVEAIYDYSPTKNLEVNLSELVLIQAENPLNSRNEISQITNHFLNSQVEKAPAESIKALIPLEDCNKSWDYKFHGDDWQCMVIIILLINLGFELIN